MSIVWIVMKIKFLLPLPKHCNYECIMRHYGKCMNIPNLGTRWQGEVSCTYQWRFMSFVTGLEAVWASEVTLSEYGGKKPLNIKVCWDVMPSDILVLSWNTECSGMWMWEHQMCRSACFCWVMNFMCQMGGRLYWLLSSGLWMAVWLVVYLLGCNTMHSATKQQVLPMCR